MASITNPGYGQVTNLANAQAGNGVSTNIVARRADRMGVASLLRITTAIGATPTCTYLVEGSAVGGAVAADWYALPTQDWPTAGGPPGALTSATFVITTAAAFWKVVPVDLPWIWLRVTFSANTNVTNTVDLYAF